jgi:hypothetical protein
MTGIRRKMEPLDSKKSPETEKLDQHKEALKHKKSKSSSKYLASMLDEAKGLLEESVLASWEMLENQRSMSKTIDSISSGLTTLNKTLTSFFSTSPSMHAYAQNIFDDMDDGSVFDESEDSSVGEGFVAMTENMSDTIIDGNEDLIDIFDDTGDKISESVNDLADDFEDFTNEFRVMDDPTLPDFVSESQSDRAASIEDYWRDSVLFELKEISGNVSRIANGFAMSSRNKRGKLGKSRDDEFDDEGFGLTDFIAGFFSFKLLKGIVKKAFKSVYDKVAGVMTKIGGFMGKIAKKMFAPFGKLIMKVMGPILNSKIAKKIAGSTAMKILGKIFKGVAKHGLKAIPVIGQIIMIADFLWDFWKGFDSKEAASITGKAEDALTFWDKFKSGLSNAISGFFLGFVDPKTIFAYVDKISNAVSKIFDDFISLVPDSWKKAGSAIYKFFNWNDKESIWQSTWTALNNMVGKIKTGISDAASKVWETAKGLGSDVMSMLPNAVSSAIASFIDHVISAGTNITSTAFDTVKDLGTMIADKVKGFLQSLLDFIPSSVKDFISSKVSAVSDGIGEMASSVSGWASKTFSGSSVASEAKTPVTIKPQALNTRTSENTDKIAKEARANSKKEAPSKGSTVINNVNNSGGKQATVSRNVNSGRSDINRAIGRGSQFNFGV